MSVSSTRAPVRTLSRDSSQGGDISRLEESFTDQMIKVTEESDSLSGGGLGCAPVGPNRAQG